MHTHPRVLDRAFARLFDGEKAQARRATLPASFLPSFLSFVPSFFFLFSFVSSLHSFTFNWILSLSFSVSLSLSLLAGLSTPVEAIRQGFEISREDMRPCAVDGLAKRTFSLRLAICLPCR